MRKLRILWHSDPATAPTGFGAYTKYILTHLYKTGKYEIANLACGMLSNSAESRKVPWKVYPTIPLHRQDVIQRANQDPNFGRLMSYGEVVLEEVIKDFKPDIYIGVQDFWGFNYALDKKFWNKIPCIAHWTADSVPLLDDAVHKAERIQHHLVWADFATQEFKRVANDLEKRLPTIPEIDQPPVKAKIEGFRRVKTLSGCVNEKSFYKLPEYKRRELREKYGFDKDTFIITTGSRNQLRKLFPQQLEGFALFKKEFPNIKSKMIFWCCQSEGWNLKKHAEEYGLDINDILIAYRCRVTGEIFYLPVGREDQDNPKTGHKGSLKSVGMDNFATEDKINEFLNLGDVFVLCITSGGFELWLSQAKLVECPTIANAYSCFEDQVGLEKGCLEVEQNFTYECGSGFRKAAVYPYSIAKQFKKVYNMEVAKRQALGKAGKEFVLKNYSVEVVSKQWEALLDGFPINESYDFNDEEAPKNPQAVIPPVQDDKEWVKTLYKLILNMDVTDDNDGVQNWMNNLKNGQPREQIHQFFVKVALDKNNEKPKTVTLESLLDNEGKDKRILIGIPKSFGDVILASALFPSLKELYPDCNLYVATEPQYKKLIDPNPNVHRWIPWTPEMDNIFHLEGIGTHKGYFKCYFPVYFGTQRLIDYTHNGVDVTNLE